MKIKKLDNNSIGIRHGDRLIIKIEKTESNPSFIKSSIHKRQSKNGLVVSVLMNGAVMNKDRVGVRDYFFGQVHAGVEDGIVRSFTYDARRDDSVTSALRFTLGACKMILCDGPFWKLRPINEINNEILDSIQRVIDKSSSITKDKI